MKKKEETAIIIFYSVSQKCNKEVNSIVPNVLGLNEKNDKSSKAVASCFITKDIFYVNLNNVKTMT